MPTPLERYQQDLQKPDFLADASQAAAVQELEKIYQNLILQKNNLNSKLCSLFGFKQQPVKGLYLWGSVGVGKTYLMDLFFDALPFTEKLRLHFHQFMQRVHEDLKKLQGVENPLLNIADELRQQARVICFDEFMVSDITDAMLLGGLFEALFQRGICLIATSNVIPDDLYKNGLQRSRFLPAIKLIKQYTQVFELQGNMDYRLRNLEQIGVYYSPLNDDARKKMQAAFNWLSMGQVTINPTLMIQQRPITAIQTSQTSAWFDFKELCEGPRSHFDYLEIAQQFQTVLLSNVPQFSMNASDSLYRFIHLVDVLYDAHIRLIISAAVPILELYTGDFFEFMRTRSRLQEMQSREYLFERNKESKIMNS